MIRRCRQKRGVSGRANCHGSVWQEDRSSLVVAVRGLSNDLGLLERKSSTHFHSSIILNVLWLLLTTDRALDDLEEQI